MDVITVDLIVFFGCMYLTTTALQASYIYITCSLHGPFYNNIMLSSYFQLTTHMKRLYNEMKAFDKLFAP